MSDCVKHGQFIGQHCPVCDGLSSGRTWAIETGGAIMRNHAESDQNADDPFVLASDRYAPELDRAWRGDQT